MKSHSWHPLPFLINSNNCRINRDIKGFSEVAFQREGSLGKLNSLEVMPLILAHANKLSRFGF
jgi:2,3-bisphosphoglycerate-independent phosphoglycerate mutase